MTIKTNQSLRELANEIISRREIDFEQVKMLRLYIFSEARIMDSMFEDGIVDRDEAETLFSINDAVSVGKYDPSWSELFVEAMTSHVLKDEMSPSRLDEEEAQFIISKIERDGRVDPVELDLLVNISASVTSAPERFHSFVLDALKDVVLLEGLVTERNAQRIRRVIYGPGSSSGKTVDDAEQRWLREIDEATGENHPSWNILKLELNIS